MIENIIFDFLVEILIVFFLEVGLYQVELMYSDIDVVFLDEVVGVFVEFLFGVEIFQILVFNNFKLDILILYRILKIRKFK